MNGPDVEGVLGRHRLVGNGRNLGAYRTEWDCECGATFITDGHVGPSLREANAAHVAAAVLAEVRAWLESGVTLVVAREAYEAAEWPSAALPAALAALAEQVGQVASPSIGAALDAAGRVQAIHTIFEDDEGEG